MEAKSSAILLAALVKDAKFSWALGLGNQLAHTAGLHKRKAAILCMHVEHSVRTPFHTMGDHPGRQLLVSYQELVRTFKPN